MLRRRLFSLVVAVLALVSATVLSLTSAFESGVRTVIADAALLDTELDVVGPSGMPIPSQGYMDAVISRFIDPTTPHFTGQPVFAFDHANPVFTPEGLQPLDGIKVLPLDTSVAQGVTILDSTIKQQIGGGDNVVVSGFSQSSTIASLEMRDLLALPADQQPSADQLSFVLLGDPSNPDGGLLSRFGDPTLPHLTLPSLELTFSGATPTDTPWDTAVYTLEYDGFADFPRYPINVLSDLNAFLGIEEVHGTYPSLTDAQLASAILLPESAGYAGHTDFFMIPTQTLPLLAPVQSIPVIGQPLYDLLEPDTKILVDLGYGNVDSYVDGVLTNGGWDQGPANVATPFAVFPQNVNWGQLLTSLGQGAEHGLQAFFGDITHGLPTALAGLTNGGGGAAADLALPSLASLPSFTAIVNALTSAVASAYSVLLPTADIANAVVTSLPLYDVNLFTDFIGQGDLLNAIGMPIAADVGLGTMAAGFEVEVLMSAVSSIVGDFTSLF